MAAASLGRLTLDLAVKLGSFEQGMTQAERKTKDTTEKMGKAFWVDLSPKLPMLWVALRSVQLLIRLTLKLAL